MTQEKYPYTEPILSVNDLRVSFKTDEGLVHAVRGVSFTLNKGETLCIVGESGSGKSVTSKTIMGILSASAVIESGSVMYGGEDLTKIDESEFHRIRGHKIGMIFQDPLSSLNPIMKVGKQITEAMLVNKNKMARMLDDLISKEEASYKNAKVRKTQTIIRAQGEVLESDEFYDKEIRELDNQIGEKKNDFEMKKIKNASLIQEINATAGKDDKSKAAAQQKADSQNKVNKAEEEALKAEIAQLIADNEKKIVELKKEKKEKHQTLEAKYREAKKAAKSLYKKEAPVLKKALKDKKKAAKAEIKQFKKDQAVKYAQQQSAFKDEKIKLDETCGKELKDLQASYSSAPSKALAKQAITKKQNEYDGRLKDINARQEQAHDDYVGIFKVTKKAAKATALRVMKEVGIPQPEVRYNQYPFEFSGGMRQRIVIAIALTANPEVLICDEPTTALDVTIQAQILELINRLKKERNMSIIFITHDLAVVANMADRVAVMYAGKIVEVGTANEIFYDPRHPYTWALLSSIPDIDSHEKLEAIPGTPPYLLNPPKGDAFAARNKYALAVDFKEEPPFFRISATHYASTWLLDKRAPKVNKPKIVSQRIKASLERAGVTNESEL